ncbi:MAG: hypothetical protein LBM99_01655 [Bacillales bacterium]|jgi:hypothetical protein|nr:hypothetical protein [Bacillales bacterium]
MKKLILLLFILVSCSGDNYSRKTSSNVSSSIILNNEVVFNLLKEAIINTSELKKYTSDSYIYTTDPLVIDLLNEGLPDLPFVFEDLGVSEIYTIDVTNIDKLHWSFETNSTISGQGILSILAGKLSVNLIMNYSYLSTYYKTSVLFNDTALMEQEQTTPLDEETALLFIEDGLEPILLSNAMVEAFSFLTSQEQIISFKEEGSDIIINLEPFDVPDNEYGINIDTFEITINNGYLTEVLESSTLSYIKQIFTR